MTTYLCTLCEYTTITKRYFIQHCNTKTHIQKEETSYTCYECNKQYKSFATYKRHKKNHDNKKENIKSTKINKMKIIESDNIKNNTLDKKIDEINESNKLITSEISIVKDKITIATDKIDESNRMVAKAITKASSLIKYLMEHHSTTPPLKKITEDDFMEKLRIEFNCKYTNKNIYRLEKELVKQYANNTFVKNISQLILKLVNHNDHEKQPIYNTDCSRNNYVIKTSAVWNEDKAGIKFGEYVIRPLLNHIRKLIIIYRRNDIEKCDISKYSIIEHEIHANTYDNTLAFEDELYDDSLIKAILNELSPYLRYLTHEINELEKFNQLEKLHEDLKEIINNSDSDSDSDEC